MHVVPVRAKAKEKEKARARAKVRANEKEKVKVKVRAKESGEGVDLVHPTVAQGLGQAHQPAEGRHPKTLRKCV